MTTSTDLVTTNGTALAPLPSAIERALIDGDLAPLSPEHRILYYNRTCESLGLNPLTKPFLYLRLNGKLLLYATADCTNQLRKIHTISVRIAETRREEDIYIVRAIATNPSGRTDESIGAVALGGLKGEALCNQLMKGETKSKRRVTLSICGLSMMDESEISSVPGAVALGMLPDGAIEGELVQTPVEAAPKQPAAPADPTIFDSDPLYKEWLELVKKADGLGLSPKALEMPAPKSKLERWTKALKAEMAPREQEVAEKERQGL